MIGDSEVIKLVIQGGFAGVSAGLLILLGMAVSRQVVGTDQAVSEWKLIKSATVGELQPGGTGPAFKAGAGPGGQKAKPDDFCDT